jgi:hypothetical protein
VKRSIPHPLSSTETSIAFSSSADSTAVTEMAILEAPAWMELSTSSEIALAVPLYPESRVAWMNLSRAMIEQSSVFSCCAFLGVIGLPHPYLSWLESLSRVTRCFSEKTL